MIKIRKFSYQLEPEQEKEVHRQINQYLKAKKSKVSKTTSDLSEIRPSSSQRLSQNPFTNSSSEKTENNWPDSDQEISMVPRSKTAVINLAQQEEIKCKFWII